MNEISSSGLVDARADRASTVVTAPDAETSDSPRSRVRSVAPRGNGDSPLSERERRIALALAEAALPSLDGDRHLPGGGPETVARLERLLADLGSSMTSATRAGLWAAEAWPITRFGRPLTTLSPSERELALVRWSEAASRHERWLLRAILTPLKSAHFDDPALYAHVGCRYGVDAPVATERAPWMQQVTNGVEVDSDLDLVCEVVVIGTGAGGAAAAYELAKLGRAVLLLEAGSYHSRSDFTGRSSDAYKKMYLGLGSTIAIGNVAATILAGRGVGGSTTINSGTCYRAPEHTLARWGSRYGLTMLSGERLAPYYERVESMLGVAEAPREYLGGVARVIARGADLLQLSHKPLRRAAPGCDGQGVCCFGCPTAAKRSTDVSYVPEALKRGAQLVTGARVERIHVEGGRARRVTASLSSGRTLTVRADAVVVAGGALSTPLLLSKNRLCKRSGWLGKNLSIHPATKVMAELDEVVDMSRGIPQSYEIDTYQREGLMFEGASTPLDVTAVALPWVGRRYMEVMDRYPHIATFGLMIQDTSRGEVLSTPGGVMILRYDMNERDLARMQRGIEILSEVFLRAGAKRVMPMIAGCEELHDERDLARLRRMRVSPGDFEVSAFHPLGTCRMGTDPSRSCVGPDGEAHDVDGLWVADGSVLPSSLGVNPQMTIMALALRTAEAIDASLSRAERSSTQAPPTIAPPSPSSMPEARISDVQLGFQETMSGTMRLSSAPHEARPFSFSIHARTRGLWDLLKTREATISGELMAEGFGLRCPLVGTLGVDLLPRQRIKYAFGFTADDGRSYRFEGHKSVRLDALRRTMTHLPGRVLDETGKVIATADVEFDLDRDLVGFLRGFGVHTPRQDEET